MDDGAKGGHLTDPDPLDVCNREPIHIPGAIQPHGALLVLEEESLAVLQASANFTDFTGQAPELTTEQIAALREVLALGDPALYSPIRVPIGAGEYEVSLHRHDGTLIAEFEKVEATSPINIHRHLQKVFAELREIRDFGPFYQRVAEFVAELTGFERVMVYQFDKDWHGEVVGEHLSAKVDSYLGHHFPASDIPAQARALYARSWLRLIPDAVYDPVPLEPVMNPRSGRPTDLSFARLRSVSPVHLEYLRNMDVRASMSISLIVNGRLWGLVACHHRSPLRLSHEVRAGCEMLGQVVSLEISAKQKALRLAEHVQATKIQTRFFDVISQEQNVMEALVKYMPALLEFMSAEGAAIRVGGRLELLGQTPPAPAVKDLVRWLEEQEVNPVLAVDSLRTVFPAAGDYRDTGSGMLAVRLSRVEPHFLIWFRPEVVTTRVWAGNPEKPQEVDMRIHPRKSFATWKETVTGKSLPWRETEIQGAREMVQALNALVLRRTERLISLNAELEKKNTDLNSFAYIAAHDLKEPLRGIVNYCAFMDEDHGEELSVEAHRKLQTIASLAKQSEELIEALNHFSKVGRIELTVKETAIQGLVQNVLVAHRQLLTEQKVEVIVAEDFPVIECDPVLVREIFSNLLTNAIRYNDKHEKRVEIGCREENGQTVFSVRDNGIGIREKHYDDVFHIFRRLHAHEEYGGGTGAGLAIVKSVIEKHGGRIWIESVCDEGTTFHFTLSSHE